MEFTKQRVIKCLLQTQLSINGWHAVYEAGLARLCRSGFMWEESKLKRLSRTRLIKLLDAMELTESTGSMEELGRALANP